MPDRFGAIAITLPARFVSEGRPVACTTRELSLGSAYLMCPTPPPAGAELSLLLQLPDADGPEELAAVVRGVATAQDGRAVGFWVDFTPGEPSLRRIAALLVQVRAEGIPTPAGLSRLPTPARGMPKVPPRVPPGLSVPAGFEPAPGQSAPPVERRSAPRLQPPQPLVVRFATVEEFILEYAANLSAGGVFIRTAQPPPLGAFVRVALELPDGGPPLQAHGVVVHRMDALEAGARGVPGAGVRFEETDPAFELRLELFLEWVEKQKR